MNRHSRRSVLIAAMAIASGVGCSTKNPQWLSDPTTAYCASHLDQACLRDFAQKAYTDATAKVVRQQEVPVHSDPVVKAESASSESGSEKKDTAHDANSKPGPAVESTPVHGEPVVQAKPESTESGSGKQESAHDANSKPGATVEPAPVHGEPVVLAKPESAEIGSGKHDSAHDANRKTGTAVEAVPAKVAVQVDNSKLLPVASVEPAAEVAGTVKKTGSAIEGKALPLTTAKPNSEHADKTEAAKSARANTTGDPKRVVSAEPSQVDLDGSIPNLAFGVGAIGADTNSAPGYVPSDKVVGFKDAGALLKVEGGVINNELIERARKVGDPALRADVLSRLLTLYAPSMSGDQINTILNSLYDLNNDKYTNALIVKLPGMLKLGDLERAKALRDTLLDAKVSPDSSFSMLAFVASCYTMAGLKQDATNIVLDAMRGGAELSEDDKKLIGMAINVANGSYPMMQDFYDYRSDEVRLHAYLTIAVIARQLDYPSVAHRSVADAVKFIQKSSVKLDRQKALGEILSLSPGIL